MDNTAALELLMQSESETGKTEWQERMIKELITGMEALITEAEERGMAIDQAQRYHRKAESALNDCRYAHALESIIESGFELSEAQEMFVKAKTFLLAAEARTSEANSSHAGMEKNKELRTSAGSAFSERNFEAAIDLSKEIIANVKEATASDLVLLIEECEQLIEKARSLDLDVTRACAIVDEARYALEEGQYSRVKPFTQNCKKVIEREMSSVLYKELYSLKTNLDNAKTNGVDISEAEALLEEAEESLENKEYPIAAQLCQVVKEKVANY
jgi:hypothetical protein